MSTRSFRRRLDRLERAINKAEEQNKDRPIKFTIDPALAKALRDDYQRSFELNCKESKDLSAAQIEEKGMLDKRIVDRVKSVRLPPDYGGKEAELDRRRLRVFIQKRMTPRARFSDTEDAEEAQLRARVLAFAQTPEGRGRQRMNDLSWELFFQEFKGQPNTPEQNNEFARLEELYPPLDLPTDPEEEKTSQMIREMREGIAG